MSNVSDTFVVMFTLCTYHCPVFQFLKCMSCDIISFSVAWSQYELYFPYLSQDSQRFWLL
jgi:hypothetical protein